MQSAPYAVDVLEELMESAVSEPVRLKASAEILDRAGVRGGMDIGLDVQVTDTRSPAQIVQERLARLASGAQRIIEIIPADTDITDAEVVVDSDETAEVQTSQAQHQNNLEVAAAAADKILPSDDGEVEQTEGFDADELDV